MKKAIMMLALTLTGCGSAGVDSLQGAPALPATAVVQRSLDTPADAKGDQEFSVELHAGWNSVGFRTVKLTRLESDASLTGLVWWDGTKYQEGAVSMDAVQRAGTSHGFWIQATAPTTLRYAGQQVYYGSRAQLPVNRGWNLITFPSDVEVTPKSLKAWRDITPAPFQPGAFYPADGGGPVNVEDRPFQPGVAYWVYGEESLTVTYPVRHGSPGEPDVPPPPAPPTL